MDPAGERVLGFVLAVRVWTLQRERNMKPQSDSGDHKEKQPIILFVNN